MSLPIKIFYPKSQIERFALTLCNLNSLHNACKETDPMEILKHVMSFMIGSLYYGLDIRKPFNPFLGETYEGYFDDGTKLYGEHILHDPPIDAIYLINEKLNFKLYG